MKQKNIHKSNGEPGKKSGSGNMGNQPKPRSGGKDGGNPGLTDMERKALLAAGRSAAEIDVADAAIRARGTRPWKNKSTVPPLLVTIRKAAKAILEEDFKGKPLASGNVFGTALTRRDLYPKGRGYHAVSDYLGKLGLDLPVYTRKAVRYYDISFLGADETAKRKREVELRLMRPEVRELLFAEIRD